MFAVSDSTPKESEVKPAVAPTVAMVEVKVQLEIFPEPSTELLVW